MGHGKYRPRHWIGRVQIMPQPASHIVAGRVHAAVALGSLRIEAFNGPAKAAARHQTPALLLVRVQGRIWHAQGIRDQLAQ